MPQPHGGAGSELEPTTGSSGKNKKSPCQVKLRRLRVTAHTQGAATHLLPGRPQGQWALVLKVFIQGRQVGVGTCIQRLALVCEIPTQKSHHLGGLRHFKGAGLGHSGPRLVVPPDSRQKQKQIQILHLKQAIRPQPQSTPLSHFSVVMTNVQAKISKHTRRRGKSKKNLDPTRADSSFSDFCSCLCNYFYSSIGCVHQVLCRVLGTGVTPAPAGTNHPVGERLVAMTLYSCSFTFGLSVFLDFPAQRRRSARDY